MSYLSNIKIEEDVKADYCDPDILERYVPADRYVMMNLDDPDLKTIPIRLPDPPPLETIDGYGLPPEKQFFKLQKMPERLVNLTKQHNTLGEIHDRLNRDAEIYQHEIEWIRLQWERRHKGYWFFCNGKPTYLDGWHYFYCNFYRLDVGLPQYRDRDRKFFIGARYAYTDTFAYYGYRVLNQDNEYRYFSTAKEAYLFIGKVDESQVEAGDFFLDMHRRVCFGFTYNKHRREGASYKAECINFCIVTDNTNAWGGIQAMDGDTAKKMFKDKLVKPFKKIPFFFKPIYEGSTDPETRLVFDVPPIRIGSGGAIQRVDAGLESEINWANSARAGAYDGDKLMFLHNDEVGKTTVENVDYRWSVQKKCLVQGIEIHGFSALTSTVGEMSKAGGQNFYNLCKKSMWDIRDSIGQTKSGLYNYFIPAYEGQEGFIDVFGNSIIDDPKEEDLWRIPNPVRDSNGELIGAKRFLIEQREKLLNSDDPEAMEDYENEMRLNPLRWSESFLTKGGASGLNIVKIARRIKNIKNDDTLTWIGNLEWNGNVPDSFVVFVEDQLKGRWKFSINPEEIPYKNEKFKRYVSTDDGPKEVWFPTHPGRLVVCGDPYKFRKVDGKRRSYGAISAFLKRDKNVDPDEKPIDEWITNRFIMTYKFRPADPLTYAEDWLKTLVFLGDMGYPEIDVPLLWDHLVNRKYDGYLLYDKLPVGGYKKTPGFSTRTAMQQIIFQNNQDYIEYHAERECHIDYLEEAKAIRGIEELTDYDLFVTYGGAIKGAETDYWKHVTKMLPKQKVFVGDFLKKRYY